MRVHAPVIALLLLFPLGGCQTLENAVSWFTTTNTTPAEANSVAAAANLYLAAAKAADAYIKSGAASPDVAAKIASLSSAARKDLDDALAAEQAGDSAKVTIAIDAFNQAYPTLLSFLQQNGVTT